MSDKKQDVNAVTTESNVEDQDYIYTPVPQNKRYGWIKMFFVWLCWNVVVGDLATGTALGSSMKFRDALIALSIGDIILVVVMIMTVYIGSKTGLAAMSLIRFTVGRVGTYIFSAIICVTSVGWFATQLGFFGQIWSQYLPISVPILAVLGGIMMASTAIKGFKGMEKLSTFAAIPLLLFIVLALVNCVRLIGVDSLFSYSPTGSQIGTMATGVTTVIGSWAARNGYCSRLRSICKDGYHKDFYRLDRWSFLWSFPASNCWYCSCSASGNMGFRSSI